MIEITKGRKTEGLGVWREEDLYGARETRKRNGEK